MQRDTAWDAYPGRLHASHRTASASSRKRIPVARQAAPGSRASASWQHAQHSQLTDIGPAWLDSCATSSIPKGVAPMPAFTVSRLLVLIALVLFLLAAFHVGLGTVDLIALGLAVYMGSHLVP